MAPTGTYEKMAYTPAVKASKSEAAKPAVGFPLGIRTVVKAVYVTHTALSYEKQLKCFFQI